MSNENKNAERDPVRTAIGLLNYMVRSGESHSEESAKAVVAGIVAYDALADAITAQAAEIERLKEELGQHDGDINERMAALGMIPLDKLLSEPPTPFFVHIAMKDMDTFKWWVESKNREYTTMRMRYETGNRDKDDDLYEWVFAHSAVFGSIADSLRAALSKEGE